MRIFVLTLLSFLTILIQSRENFVFLCVTVTEFLFLITHFWQNRRQSIQISGGSVPSQG